MKSSLQFIYSAGVAAALFAVLPARADNMASIAITPATGAVSLTPRWSIGSGLAGFHLMTQALPLGSGANDFYSIKSETIPAGGDVLAFDYYVAGSGAATSFNDIGSKLTPNSYSALTSADPNIDGYGAVNFYLIHHKTGGDYFTAIIPGSATASAVTDLKPMSGPGGPSTLGASGYFGLTFSATDLGYGANLFYYLRNDAATGFAFFGTLDPALLGNSTDKFNLGMTGFNFLTFTSTDVGFGASKMYYTRLDPITGYSILGTLDPVTGKVADVANLGSVYSTLDFVPGDVGFGVDNFYTTGSINAAGQTVSFAAQINRAISAGSFTVAPSAGSGLAVTLTVVPGSVGAAAISAPVAGVFTVTPTAPGLITLQATQAGQSAPTAYEFNMLRQSFTITGAAILAITTQPTGQAAVTGNTATFTVAAAGTTALSYQWQKGGVNLPLANASATTATLSLPAVSSADAATYDVVVTDAAGSLISNPVVLTVNTAAPIITNAALTAAGTVGASFSYTIAANGAPTAYSAAPLPAGLSVATGTGVISGTPTASGTTNVILGATNGTGTGNATLVITVAPAGVAPIITNNPLTAAGMIGSTFSYTIVASGLPTSYSASPLPAGLLFNSATGTISGTPTTLGLTNVTLGATNGTGTGTATLAINVAAAGIVPAIVNPSLTVTGVVGTPLGYTIVATGTPASYAAAGLPAGLAIVSATGVITGTPTTPGVSAVQLSATNAFGTGQATLTINIAAAPVPPVFTSPTTAAGTAGAAFATYQIATSGSPTSYAATGLPAGLTLNAQTGAITGTPTVSGVFTVQLSATNSAGTTTSTLTITLAAAPYSRIVNFSLRALSGPGTQSLDMGFVILGDSKDLLIRGIGPSLAPFGITNFLVDPMLTLYSGNTVIGANDDWGTASTGLSQSALVASTELTVGAFSLPTGSKDSALITTLNHGAYTASVLGANSATGVALAEVYDTDTTPGARLVNVSARMTVGTGNGALLAGFVILGNTPKTVLIRGIGPSLAAFGVANVMADPQLALFQNGTVIASNDNWGTGTTSAATIAATSAQVGAFALTPGSLDAVVLITLQPGIYSVQLMGGTVTSGIALIEIYDVL